MARPRQQAADRGRTLQKLLNILGKTVPAFADLISSERWTPRFACFGAICAVMLVPSLAYSVGAFVALRGART